MPGLCLGLVMLCYGTPGTRAVHGVGGATPASPVVERARKLSDEEFTKLVNALGKQKDYKALKETLNKFIPLIRFSDISSTDLIDHVSPFKEIIPNDIYEEVEKFYIKNTLPKKTIILPPRVGVELKLIKPKLTSIIAGCIDRKNPKNQSFKRKYKFKLLYSMSRDGFNNVTFYNKCIGQGPFVVITRVQSKKIYGGYNPIGYTGKSGHSSFSTRDIE